METLSYGDAAQQPPGIEAVELDGPRGVALRDPHLQRLRMSTP